MMTREKAIEILRQVAKAILETVEEAGPDGAPLGPMYAAVMTHGMRYEYFMQIIHGLEDAGKIKVSNNCARIVR